MSPSHLGVPDASRAGPFASTHWSVVLAARDRATPQAREALAILCQAYWYPVYAYIRRRVDRGDEAEDLTQEFFTLFLEKDFLATVDRDKGKFRSFLRACCDHFLANQRDRDRAQKRGGGRPLASLDFGSADERYQHEPADSLTPEALFERRWALTLLEEVLARLGAEYEREGKANLAIQMRSLLGSGPETPSHAEVARILEMTEGAVKKAAQRYRQRYRELLREQIGATVGGPELIDDEIRTLFAVFAP